MGILKDSDKKQLETLFAGLSGPVQVLLFTQKEDCEYCENTQEMLEEVSGLSDKISLSVHDKDQDAELAQSYGVDKVPAIVLKNEKDYGIRFFGIPAGYEFATLVEDIQDVSSGKHDLTPPILESLGKVDQPVNIQVLVTPS